MLFKSVSRILSLGAVWANQGHYYGPSLSTGADGSHCTILDVVHDERTAVIVISDACPRGFREELAAYLIDSDCTFTERPGRADDVASLQLTLEANGEHCAGTGVILCHRRTVAPRMDTVFAAWMTTDHGLFDGCFGADEEAWQALLRRG